MCPSAPRVCSEPGGQKPILSLYYCILAHEACVTAEANPNFVIMVLRSNETLPCVEWVSFSGNYGVQQGYPIRVITGYYTINKQGTPARAFNGQTLLTGWPTTGAYKAYVFDSNQIKTTLDDGFDILVVHTQCSTAWVPYRVGESIPPRAVVAGSENSMNRYVIDPGLPYVRFGRYTIGYTHGYYLIHNNTFSCTNMLMLVTLSG